MTTKRPNNNKMTYESASDETKYVIDGLAAYLSPTQVSRNFEKRFGKALAKQQVNNYRNLYQDLILERRAKIKDEIPIMNPTARLMYLQEIYETAMKKTVETRNGDLIDAPDLTAAINAIKVAEQIAPAKAEESDEVRAMKKLANETLDEFRKSTPELDDTQRIELLTQQLPELREYLALPN